MPLNRKLFQVSSRTLLVSLTITCVWLGWITERAREQREAVKAIGALGGNVTYDWQTIEPSSEQPPGPAWLRRMIGDVFFQEPVSAWFEETKRPDEKVVDEILEGDRLLRLLGRLNQGNASTARIKKALPILKRLRKLRAVVVSNQISNESKRALSAELPGCEVYYFRPPVSAAR